VKKLITLILIGVLFMSCSKEKDVAVISTQFGDMVVEFYPETAPMHVESFTILAKEEYFDGTTFHRVIPGFVIQGGDPNSKDTNRLNDGIGGRAGNFFGIGRENDPDTWMIPGEFNDKLHVKGTLSMARGETLTVHQANSLFVTLRGLILMESIQFLDKLLKVWK